MIDTLELYNMKKKQLILLETVTVIFVLSLLAWFMIPKFLYVNQNINRAKYFPDPAFHAAVQKFMRVEPGDLFTAKEAAAKSGILDFANQGVKSVAGLKYIKSVTKIQAQDNQLKEIDLSSQTELETIDLGNNLLSTLDVSNNMKLSTLLCGNNQLEEIKLAEYGEIFTLIVSNNKLTSLDVAKSPKLYDLFFSGNQIKNINLSQNPDLKRLLSMGGELTSIDLSNNTKLYSLQIIGNQLEKFPDLSKNPKLRVVDFRSNNIDCDSLPAINSFKKIFTAESETSFQYSQQNGLELDECTAEN